MATTEATTAAASPRGYLDFKAIKMVEADRVVYIGAMPIFELMDRGFVAPAANEGLTAEILTGKGPEGPVQRKTNSAHVQGIVNYIVATAESGDPWTFNSIVLYTTEDIEFETNSVGHISSGEARATEAFRVGEGLHRCLAWAVALGVAKIRGVKRPEMSEKARKRIERAAIPVLVVAEKDLDRQKGDFHKLNQQKPLTSTVLALTDDSELSELTKKVIVDVPLFKGRIDVNNASVGVKSDKILAFAQLRFIVASYLVGRDTRSKEGIASGIEEILAERGKRKVRAELKEVFTEVANRLGELPQLQARKAADSDAGDLVREIRAKTLLTSSAAWRALFVAIHEAEEEGVATKTAISRVQKKPKIWSRKDKFFLGSLIDRKTKKLLSSRESIDAGADKLLEVMVDAG